MIVDPSQEAPHIRPKVRSRHPKAEKKADDDAADIDAMLDDTRARLDAWLGVGQPEPSKPNQPEPPKPKPAGILKKAKYANKDDAKKSSNSKEEEEPMKVDSTTTTQTIEQKQDLPDKPETETPPAQPAVKGLVVERKPSAVAPIQVEQTTNPMAVEGYVPKTDEQPKPTTTEDADGKPIIFSSLSELMEEAGTLPDQNAEPKVIEADLAFSVLSEQEYEEEQAELTEDQRKVFEGRFDAFSDDEATDTADDLSFLQHREDDEDYWSDEEDDTEERPPPEPRSFMKLWDALASWATPEALNLIRKWQQDSEPILPSVDWVPMVDSSEVAASRCAGAMAMVQMNLQKCLSELEQSEDINRVAKHRLADLLRSFHYSRPTPRLDTRLWRALTCILVDIVLVLKIESAEGIPVSAKAVDISVDEYKYLTQSCFESLGAGSGGADPAYGS